VRGGGSNPLDDSSLWSSVGREKEGWVINPKLVAIDVLFNLLDNVIESADCPGEIIYIEVGDYSILGSAPVSVVLHRSDKADKQLVQEESNVRGEKGHFAGMILNQSSVFLLVTKLKRVMMQLYSKGRDLAWV